MSEAEGPGANWGSWGAGGVGFTDGRLARGTGNPTGSDFKKQHIKSRKRMKMNRIQEQSFILK